MKLSTRLSSMAVVIAATLLGQPLTAQSRPPGASDISSQNVGISRANDQTRALLQAQMAERNIPGLQVAVVVNGRVVMSETYGIADIEQSLPATSQTLFPINSATKSFTGVAILQLVEEGLVNLDAPISRYLSDLPEAWRGVRIRQLLAHSSGLPNIVDENGLVGGGTDAEAWTLVQTLPMDGVPGAGFAYNQTNYVLLGRLIEALSGKPFETFLQERQFTPAAMAHARFGDGYDVVPGRTAIYINQHAGHSDATAGGDTLYHWIDDIPVSTRAGAGLYTTADDMARWIIALEDVQLLQRPESLDALWRPDRLNDGTPNIWAMGWPILTNTTRRAVGGIGGGRSAFFIYPDDHVAVIVMTNRVGANPQNLIDQIASFYIDPD